MGRGFYFPPLFIYLFIFEKKVKKKEIERKEKENSQRERRGLKSASSEKVVGSTWELKSTWDQAPAVNFYFF